MYKCKYFQLKELVHPNLYSKYGEKLWIIFDERLLKFADLVREKYGPCTVNGSGLTNCGLRDFNSNTGAALSCHKFGKALDLHILSIEREFSGDKQGKAKAYKTIREELLALPGYEYINFETTSAGKDITWLHIDTGNRTSRTFNA